MIKFQEKIKSIGVMLMLVFPICFVLTLLCSDYRGEDEYNQYVVISKFFINWYTFVTLPIGMLFYSIGWFDFSPKKNKNVF
jgi:hypothetical protein